MRRNRPLSRSGSSGESGLGDTSTLVVDDGIGGMSSTAGSDSTSSCDRLRPYPPYCSNASERSSSAASRCGLVAGRARGIASTTRLRIAGDTIAASCSV